MRRELNSSGVDFLIVNTTNTNIHQDLTLEDIVSYRKKEGYPDIGYHYVIHRDGVCSGGIPFEEAGTHTSHFDRNSIGILLVGGCTTRGKPFDNHTPEQKETLLTLLHLLSRIYPKAKPVGAGELVGGTSPHFDIGKFYDAGKHSLETPH